MARGSRRSTAARCPSALSSASLPSAPAGPAKRRAAWADCGSRWRVAQAVDAAAGDTRQRAATATAQPWRSKVGSGCLLAIVPIVAIVVPVIPVGALVVVAIPRLRPRVVLIADDRSAERAGRAADRRALHGVPLHRVLTDQRTGSRAERTACERTFLTAGEWPRCTSGE